MSAIVSSLDSKISSDEGNSERVNGVIILTKRNERWEKTLEFQTQGVGLDYSGVADITGDGIKEYLFDAKFGASAGKKLEIFNWNHNSLKMVAEVPYHMMELLSNKKNGISVWQRYIADTYFVDVLE